MKKKRYQLNGKRPRGPLDKPIPIYRVTGSLEVNTASGDAAVNYLERDNKAKHERKLPRWGKQRNLV